MMEFLKRSPKWTRKPKEVKIDGQKVVVTTEKGTDLWARTYYGFQNDNAPVFQIETSEKYFSFVVKTEFESSSRFDQCGVVMYLDSDNWFKASIEYEDDKIQRLGSVVTNHGYSDWATTDISSDIKHMWYRFHAEKAIIVSKTVKTAFTTSRCGFFICGKALVKSLTGFTLAARQMGLIRQPFPLCRSRIVNGKVTRTGKCKGNLGGTTCCNLNG